MALTLAKEANEQYQGSDDPSYSLLMAHIALGLKKEAEFRQATEALMQKYPDLMATHYCNAIRLAMDGSFAAEDEIKKAERLGLPSQAVQDFLAFQLVKRSRPEILRDFACQSPEARCFFRTQAAPRILGTHFNKERLNHLIDRHGRANHENNYELDRDAAKN
jgi:hypothetical protein